MLTCKRCRQRKPATAFYARDTSCKECRKPLVRANRLAKLEHYQAYDRERFQKDPIRRESTLAKAREYTARNPLKKKARTATQTAIDSGRLVRQPCEICGVDKVEAHHDDYAKPLEVRWLCRKHHMEHHRSAA